MLYSLTSVVPFPNITVPNPFSVDTCSGAIKTTGNIRRYMSSAYAVTVNVQNFGILPLLSSTCSFTVNVTAVNLPPSLTTTSFLVFDQQPAGTLVGSVGATSPNGYSVSFAPLTQVSPSGLAVAPFAVVPSGAQAGTIYVNDPTLSSFKYSIFVMTANFTDGIYWVQQNVSIVLADSPRPPTCFPTTLNVSQSAPVGATMNGGALQAVHPQGLTMTYAIVGGSGASYFAANATTGVVTLAASLASASLPLTNAYSLLFSATDTNGKVATCPLSAAVIISYHTPTAAPLNVSTPDGTSAGSIVGTVVGATIDNGVTLVYSLMSCQPVYSYGCPFSVDAVTGNVVVAAAAGRFAYSNAYSYAAAPMTFTLSVMTRAFGVLPPQNTTSSVFVLITNIAPYLSLPTGVTVQGYASGGSVGSIATNLMSSVITPAGQSRAGLSFTLAYAYTFENNVALQLNPNGDVVIQCNCWNLQTTQQLRLPVLATDSASGQTASGTLMVAITHYNQPPVWVNTSSLAITVIEAMPGPVGPPLLSYVYDWDISNSAKGDNETFSLVAGNVNGVFAIDAKNGQLSVVNASAVNLVYGNPPFSLGVRVTDKGTDGPQAFSTDATISITIVPSQSPPTLAASYSFSVAEHSALGTLVGGRITGATSVPCDAPSTCSTFSYALVPAGANVNQPWPFSVAQVPSVSPPWGLASCQIVVSGAPIDYSPFLGQGLFRVYNATLVITEQRLGVGALTGSAPVTISVTYVAEPPFFNPTVTLPPATPAQLNRWSFTAYVNERSAPGTNLSFVSAALAASPGFVLTAGAGSPAAVAATSKDPFAVLTYSLVTASPSFAIDPATAQLSIKAGAAPLLFNSASQYSLQVKATDGNGLSDTATVIVKIIEINQPAAFYGLSLAAGGLQPPATVFLSELAQPGTVVAVANFTDSNSYAPWAARNLALAGAGSGLFAVSASGSITVVGALSWNDQATFNLTVSCSDSDPLSPLTTAVSVLVVLNQTNRVSITSFAPAAGAIAGSFALASGASYAASYAALNDVLFASTGSSVLISGTGFGFTGSRLAAAGAQLVPTVTFGPVTGAEYAASGCSVTTAGSAITCAVPAGVGRDLVWLVRFGNFTSPPSSRRTSYMPPTISAVTIVGGATTMSTSAAGVTLQVVGTGFGTGSGGTAARLYYGQPGQEVATYATTCSVTTAQTTLQCPALPGVGAGLSFIVFVGAGAAAAGQPGVSNSSAFAATAVAYTAPTVTAVGAAAGAMDTRGGAKFNVSGTNLGPLATPLLVSYGNDLTGGTQPVFVATGCAVTVAHTQALCTAAAGIGSGFVVSLTVLNQAAPNVPSTLAYLPPTLTGLSGQSISAMSTLGGAQVLLAGNYFGPLGLTLGNGIPAALYGHPGALNLAATQCTVTVAHTQISCLSAPGSGAALVWKVVVGAQASNATSNLTTSYMPPSVSLYSGPGVTAATIGGQVVNITGNNFGPFGSPLTSVTYGRTGTEFIATPSCALTVAHTQITCSTTVGAGAGMTWTVTVDGQRSIAPTTAYLAPVITSFSGAGAVNASTDGGDLVVITGQYFSTQQFLGAVTYGLGGAQFVAQNCTVTVPHTQISCRTVAGTGRALQWVVTVGNQTSARSATFTSYAIPTLTSAVPGSGPTSGGTVVTVTGANLGFSYAASNFQVLINTKMLARPAGAGYYAGLMYAGLPDDGSTTSAAWLGALTSAPNFNPVIVSRSIDTVQFTLPPGFGSSADLLLLVDGVPSNIVSFAYDPPLISNLAPTRLNVATGYLQLTIEGVNFCASAGCGFVTVNGQAYQAPFTALPYPAGSPPAGFSAAPLNWSHTSVVVVVPDPLGSQSTVQVTVGGVASNVVSFSAPVPAVSSLTGQGSWGGGSSTLVSSASVSFGLTLLGAAVTPAVVSTPAVAGPLRAAVANSSGRLPVSAVTITSITSTATGAVTTVAANSAANTVNCKCPPDEPDHCPKPPTPTISPCPTFPARTLIPFPHSRAPPPRRRDISGREHHHFHQPRGHVWRGGAGARPESEPLGYCGLFC